jgi:hypothetical protein
MGSGNGERLLINVIQGEGEGEGWGIIIIRVIRLT